MRRSIRTIAGFSLIVAGAIGTLVPVVPGVPMLLAGVALVGTDHPWIRAAKARWRAWSGGRPRTAGAA
jgi:hypothetical protein